MSEQPELRKETTKQNHKRVMRSGSWIQTTGPNNGHQLGDYSKSSRSGEPSPNLSEQEYFAGSLLWQASSDLFCCGRTEQIPLEKMW